MKRDTRDGCESLYTFIQPNGSDYSCDVLIIHKRNCRTWPLSFDLEIGYVNVPTGPCTVCLLYLTWWSF